MIFIFSFYFMLFYVTLSDDEDEALHNAFMYIHISNIDIRSNNDTCVSFEADGIDDEAAAAHNEDEVCEYHVCLEQCTRQATTLS